MSSRKGSLIANHFVDRVLELMPSIFTAIYTTRLTLDIKAYL